MSHLVFLDAFFTSALSTIMATLEELSSRESTKRASESFASAGSTLRSASPGDMSRVPRVRFESLPLPPGKDVGGKSPTPKPTLAQIFNFDGSAPREKTLFNFHSSSPAPEPQSSGNESGGEESDELRVYLGEEGRSSEHDDSSESGSEGSPESEGLTPKPVSILVPCSSPSVKDPITKASTPSRLEVPTSSRGVTPVMTTTSNPQPPPLQGKSTKIEHVLEVRTPTKVKFTLQPPESVTPASVDPPSSEIRQPTRKLTACNRERLTIAQVKKRYLSYAQQLKNEKSRAKLLSMKGRGPVNQRKIWSKHTATESKPSTVSTKKAELAPPTPATRAHVPSSSSHPSSEVTADDVLSFMSAHPALVAPPVTLLTDLDLLSRLTPVLVQEVREKIDTFTLHLKEAQERGESLAPLLRMWEEWVTEHNAFVLHDKLCDPKVM